MTGLIHGSNPPAEARVGGVTWRHLGSLLWWERETQKDQFCFKLIPSRPKHFKHWKKTNKKKQTIIMQQVCFFLHILLMQLSYPPLNLFQPTFRWPDIMRKLLLHPCASAEATDYGKRPISGCYAIIRELEIHIHLYRNIKVNVKKKTSKWLHKLTHFSISRPSLKKSMNGVTPSSRKSRRPIIPSGFMDSPVKNCKIEKVS